MTLSNQALSSAADKDLELSKQACQEAVNEVIQKIIYHYLPNLHKILLFILQLQYLELKQIITFL